MDGTSAAGIGAQLRAARRAAGWTQQELARRSGVSRPTVGLIERGHPNGELGKVLAMVKALGLQLRLERGPAQTFSLDVLETETEPL
ncbi:MULTISPECIES: helix-turn-helix domain-containing protein [unclassified Isoptericola]|uniref:helix-turn-helix domain-containing protein n=1 Tax=unclassified Isoptericola TaxID=2623355 RepID=UPI002712AD3D|nr:MULTISPECIES: helix-turn-helix domain-containing protein [unclassified Isoptericola]MDO8147688.1 helix-turn-helix domain-containing protein [Isoptericola sp. b515]MDO8150010.1 helix-turn-helix domain-containing protein [Isoptericola sp. b408]